MKNSHEFFISHSSKTKELARHIFYLAVANDISVWYDEALLERGNNVKEFLRRGIESSNTFLLLHCKQAMDSSWVAFEMEVSEQKAARDPLYRRIVIKLDDEALPESWQPFLYTSWNQDDLPGSISGVLLDITRKKLISDLAGTALLSMNPSLVFQNNSGTIAEHSRNYVLYYLAHIKLALTSLSETRYTTEVQDSLVKILQLSLFKDMPLLHGGIFPIEPGVYEVVYGSRMIMPPKITMRNLPDHYSCLVLSNNEISCKVAIVDAVTKEIVRHPTPFAFSIELDARL